MFLLGGPNETTEPTLQIQTIPLLPTRAHLSNAPSQGREQSFQALFSKGLPKQTDLQSMRRMRAKFHAAATRELLSRAAHILASARAPRAANKKGESCTIVSVHLLHPIRSKQSLEVIQHIPLTFISLCAFLTKLQPCRHQGPAYQGRERETANQ